MGISDGHFMEWRVRGGGEGSVKVQSWGIGYWGRDTVSEILLVEIGDLGGGGG